MACVLVSYGVAYKNYYVEDVTELAEGYIQRDYDFQVVSDYISAPPLDTDPETGEEMLLCSDVYVECGYDSSGNEVSGDAAAVMFNVYLESSDASAFYRGLRNGYMYVVKRF